MHATQHSRTGSRSSDPRSETSDMDEERALMYNYPSPSPTSPITPMHKKVAPPRRVRRAVLSLLLVFTLAIFSALWISAPAMKSLLAVSPARPVEQQDVSIPVYTVTQTVTVHAAATATPVPVPVPGPQPVVFALIMFSTDSAREGAVLMKSALMYSSAPVEFHIICDQAAEEYLRSRLSLVTHPMHSTRTVFYQLTREQMIARVAREGRIASDHSAGNPGLMKLFIHEILPESVEKAIFVDTDAFFLTDPAQLMRLFSAFEPGKYVSIPMHENYPAPEWHDASKICSCVMLLDLAGLRRVRLMDSELYRERPGVAGFEPSLSPPAFEKMYGVPTPTTDNVYANVKLGDQGYWWAIVNKTNIARPLNLEWETTSCLMQMYGTNATLGSDNATIQDEMSHQKMIEGTYQAGQPIFPKLVHFNCMDSATVYWEWNGWTDAKHWSLLGQRWWQSVQHHVGFKWLWLNHGDKEPVFASASDRPRMIVESVREVKFADELFAEAHPQVRLGDLMLDELEED